MNPSREALLVQTFVIPAKRARYVDFVSSPKGRPKFLRELHHFADFAPSVVVELDASNNSSHGLIADLRRRGATEECYLISNERGLDGATKQLDVAIREVFTLSEGTIVCCVPGKLAYFEGEGLKNRFILHRQAAT